MKTTGCLMVFIGCLLAFVGGGLVIAGIGFTIQSLDYNDYGWSLFIGIPAMILGALILLVCRLIFKRASDLASRL